jgi:6-phosphogluconolactonase
MKNFELISFTNADELARAAASAWLDEIAAASHAAKTQNVALSGGRIALKFFTAIVEQSKARAISLGLVHFFWADERCVPPDDAESNFRAAHQLLFAPLRISDAQIHRIHGENLPELAAQKATTDISHIVPKNSDGQPVLDLIFLGLGEDGHVASLFPGQIEGTFPKAIFCPVRNSPKPPPDRVSLTYAAIAAAREVWVLASGAGKEDALRESLYAGGRTPLAQVIQARTHTKFFSDIQLS